MAGILNSTFLNLAILDSAIIVCPLKVTHTCQDWFPTFAQKNFTHSFWLNLMIAAILNTTMLDWDTAILDSDTLLSSLRFTQKHSHSTLALNQTNSIWLIWWWQPSWILLCWIETLPSWIQTPCYLLSDSLKNTLTPLWLWPKLIQSDSNSFILTYLSEGIHLEFCHVELGHLGFSHHSFSSKTYSHLPRLVPTIYTKKLHSFILTQLDDGRHLEFCHVGFSHFAQKNFTHSFWLNLIMAAILNSVMLDSDTAILDSEHLVIFSQISLKNPLTPLWLWLKLIQSD